MKKQAWECACHMTVPVDRLMARYAKTAKQRLVMRRFANSLIAFIVAKSREIERQKPPGRCTFQVQRRQTWISNKVTDGLVWRPCGNKGVELTQFGSPRCKKHIGN